MANKKPIVLNSSGQLEQIQSGDVIDPAFYTAGSGGGLPIASAGGTVDAITADFSPDLTLTDKVMCAVVSGGANTSTTPTFAPDGLTARTITKKGGSALIAGDIGPSGFVMLLEYNSANTRWELLNPSKVVEADITLVDNTTDDVSSTKHGFTPKSPADATKFLNGDTTPAFALVKDSDLSTSDITTNNFSTAKHGFVPKGTANAYEFLNGNAAWKEPIEPSLRAMNLLGGVILGQTVGYNPFLVSSAGAALTDNQARFIAVYLPQAATITGVKWIQTIQGSYTADQYNGVGLYSYSGGTLTLQASSANDGNIWKGAVNVMQSKAFSSTYAAVAGIYFIGILYNNSAQTTAPALGSFSMSASSIVIDLTNSAKISSTLAAQNSLPSPQASSGLGSSTNLIYMGIY